MEKWRYYLRLLLAVVCFGLSVAAIIGFFYPIKIFDAQLLALGQRTFVDFSVFAGILFLSILLFTFLFGRLYCSIICPLGVWQELLGLLFRRKQSKHKNLAYKYIIAAVVWGMLIGGSVFIARMIDPYTLFGSAMTGVVWGGVVLFLIAILVCFKGRWFCTNICPVGAALGIISKHGVCKIYVDEAQCVSCGQCAAKCSAGCIDFKNKAIDNEACVKCLKCLDICPKNAIHYGIKPAQEVPFNSQRRRLLVGGVALVAVFALAVKGGIALSKNVAAKVKKVILPAGAGNVDDFANRCLNCNLCVQNCPMKIIKKADGDVKTVHLDYQDGFCDYDCHKCSEICPSGAIKRISLAEKQKTQIALAMIDNERCVKCGLCVRKCPRQIIVKEGDSFPMISADECIGCGACAQACPVQAITIVSVEKQRVLG